MQRPSRSSPTTVLGMVKTVVVVKLFNFFFFFVFIHIVGVDFVIVMIITIVIIVTAVKNGKDPSGIKRLLLGRQWRTLQNALLRQDTTGRGRCRGRCSGGASGGYFLFSEWISRIVLLYFDSYDRNSLTYLVINYIY